LPRELFGSPLEIFGLGTQFLTYIGNLVQLFTAIQYLVNIFAHNGVNLGQIFRQLRFVAAARPGTVTVFALLSLNDRVVVNELERSRRLVDLQTPL